MAAPSSSSESEPSPNVLPGLPNVLPGLTVDPQVLLRAAEVAGVDIPQCFEAPVPLFDEHGVFIAWRLPTRDGMWPGQRRAPGNWETRIRGFQGTSEQGLTGLLADRRIKAVPVSQGGCGDHGFYCVAYEDYPRWHSPDDGAYEWLVKQRAEKIKEIMGSMKNRCGIIVEVLCWGKHKSLKKAADGTEEEHVRPGQFTHTPKPRDHIGRWCVHPDDARVTGLILDPLWSER